MFGLLSFFWQSTHPIFLVEIIANCTNFYLQNFLIPRVDEDTQVYIEKFINTCFNLSEYLVEDILMLIIGVLVVFKARDANLMHRFISVATAAFSSFLAFIMFVVFTIREVLKLMNEMDPETYPYETPIRDLKLAMVGYRYALIFFISTQLMITFILHQIYNRKHKDSQLALDDSKQQGLYLIYTFNLISIGCSLFRNSGVIVLYMVEDLIIFNWFEIIKFSYFKSLVVIHLTIIAFCLYLLIPKIKKPSKEKKQDVIIEEETVFA